MLGLDRFSNKALTPTVDPEPEPAPVDQVDLAPEPAPAVRPETAALLDQAEQAYETEVAARESCCQHCLKHRLIRPLAERIANARLMGPSDRGWTDAELEEERELKTLVAAADAELERVRGTYPRAQTYSPQPGWIDTVPPDPTAIAAHDSRVRTAEGKWRRVNDQLTELGLRVSARQMNAANAAIAEQDEQRNQEREAMDLPRLDEGHELITIRGDAREIANGFRRN